MFFKKIGISLFFIPILFLSGCNHLKRSCLEINWYEVGRQDSRKGLKWEKTFSQRRQVCGFENTSSYQAAYKNGFDAGLREYCSFKTGYIYGLSKTKNQARECPENLRKSFINGYQTGLYIDKIQKKENALQKKLETLEQKVKVYEKHVTKLRHSK